MLFFLIIFVNPSMLMPLSQLALFFFLLFINFFNRDLNLLLKSKKIHTYFLLI